MTTQGGISPELMEEAKAAMLAIEMDFAEPQPPSARSGAGYPSLGGYIETHFDFAACQRPDGSKYGTGGQCRKGTPTTAGSDDAKKSKASASKGGGGGSGPTKADISSKRKEVRELDKTAKAADKAANKADAAWRKSGGKTGTPEHKNVKALDKAAKAANKEADKGERELKRMVKSAESGKKRQQNVSVNNALKNVTQDGPAPTGKQRQQAMKVLRQERNRLESMEDDGKLTKAGKARLNLIKASQREYEKG